ANVAEVDRPAGGDGDAAGVELRLEQIDPKRRHGDGDTAYAGVGCRLPLAVGGATDESQAHAVTAAAAERQPALAVHDPAVEPHADRRAVRVEAERHVVGFGRRVGGVVDFDVGRLAVRDDAV